MDEASWHGRVTPAVAVSETIELRAILRTGGGTAASPFLGKCDDSANWWIKPPVPGMTKALVSEWVVGRLGHLIGAPVCQVALVRIPEALLPCEFSPGRPLVAGIGCGSRDLEGTPTEKKGQLEHRESDDNRRRHAGVYALVDWFFGNDLQWLHDVADDWTLYSHDHGWYLPPDGADWTTDQLRATADQACAPTGDAAGIDDGELTRLAGALDSLTPEQIAEVLRSVPAEWGATAEDLQCLGAFLEHRATHVAERLRNLGGMKVTA